MDGSDIFRIPRLTEDEFSQFAKLIYKESGIFLKENKITLLSNRLRKRLKELNLPDYISYLQFVQKPENRKEIISMLDVVSTNETYFFRNAKQFDSMVLALQELVRPESGKAGHENIRIWSAGCSTGEEPYTMAIVCAEHKSLLQGRKVEIIATDISTSVLQFAQQGVYSGRRIEKVEPALLKKYFIKENEKDYRINDTLREMVTFQRHNLFHDPYPKNLDIIFNRNVMIYFDKEHQKKLVEGFADVLREKGFLFIGHAETLYNLTERFAYRKLGESPVYTRVNNG